MKHSSKLPIEVDLIAQLADLKEVDYKHSLLLTALIELLQERGILTHHDIIQRAQSLDNEYPLYSKYDTSFPTA